MIVLSKEELELNKAKNKEWIITNGIGGYASSTILNLNTRRYHGLLVSALDFTKRIVALQKLEETVGIGSKVYNLGINQYPGIVYPEGNKYLQSFIFNVFPTFHYKIKGVEVSKSIVMPHNHNAVVIRYLINAKRPFKFSVRPLINLRNFHSLNYDASNRFSQVVSGSSTVIKEKNNPDFVIILGSDLMKYKQSEFWIYNIEYPEERERGYDFREHSFSPGEFYLGVKRGVSVVDILCTANKKNEAYTDFDNFCSNDNKMYKGLFNNESSRINSLVKETCDFNKIEKDLLLTYLVEAADSFIVKRKNLKSVIAGYYWFGDYGRDALISLTGLCLIRGGIRDAKDILLYYKSFIKNGLIPVLINENGVPEYNSVDTSLWFIYAIYKFYEYTKNISFIKENLWNEMKSIIDSYKKGTQFYIKVDNDGLVDTRSNLPLTWMDTQFTVRSGKNVEVNALWYNCLRIMDLFAYKFGESNVEYAVLAKKAKKSFNKQFWVRNYLADTIDGNMKDISVRPNQIFAISLPFSLLTKEKEILVLKKVNEELLTPFGLRSLSNRDYRYLGKCYGSQIERDKAYHNGAVWGWLLGPYLSAYLRLHNYSSFAKGEVKEKIIKYISLSMKHAGIGTISEIYDGDYPFTPRGCISQAWSVAEMLRSYVEDVLNK